ncbi:unnamed protein product, partial [marine sediment metagenome]
DDIAAEDIEDGLHEYLCDKVEKDFDAFETGCCLSGELEGVFLVIPDPLEKYGLDLSHVKNKIESEARRLKLELVGDFGLVGGVYVS